MGVISGQRKASVLRSSGTPVSTLGPWGSCACKTDCRTLAYSSSGMWTGLSSRSCGCQPSPAGEDQASLRMALSGEEQEGRTSKRRKKRRLPTIS